MLDGPSLEQRGALCAEEPLIEQPSLALCTGILAQENTLITAGHCLRGDLEKLVFVQGYVLGNPVVAAEQVHHILEILTSVDRDIAAESGADFAVAQLAGETKLPEVQFPEQAWTPTLGERVVVMGTSEGLPLKIEDGGSVFDARAQDYFEVTSDTFAGGSGSPVFTSEGTFRGVLVGGAEDYRWDLDKQCYVRRRLEEPTGRGEIVVRAEVLKAALAVALEAEAASHASASCGFSGRSPNKRGLGWIWITMAVTIGATARMLIRDRQ